MKVPTTYEMIKALPGKGTNWPRLVDALHDHYLRVYTLETGHFPSVSCNSEREWKSAKGVRELRQAAMEAAGYAVDIQSRKSHFIPPSKETLDCGGFLGGEHVSWTDKEASETAELAIAEIIQSAK